MKRVLLGLSFAFLIFQSGLGQTCTITSSGDWSTRVCNETGLAPVSGDLIVISDNVIVEVTTNTPDPIHTGNFEIYGILNINKPDVRINGNITIKGSTAGELEIEEKLMVGDAPQSSCNFKIIIESGGLVEFPGSSSSEKLFICGVEVARAGNSGCNPYPTGPVPYCEPGGGFTGPSGLDESGALPISLLYFTVKADQEAIDLSWATTMEENFSHFVIQRSSDGLTFEDVGEVQGQGFNISNIISKYRFTDETPLLGFNYYRLKAVDLDDRHEFFDVEVAKIQGARKLAVYPNPSAGDVVSFRTNFNPAETDRILIFDQLGTALVDQAVKATINSVSFTNDLKPGIYFLKYISRDFEQVVKISVND